MLTRQQVREFSGLKTSVELVAKRINFEKITTFWSLTAFHIVSVSVGKLKKAKIQTRPKRVHFHVYDTILWNLNYNANMHTICKIQNTVEPC